MNNNFQGIENLKTKFNLGAFLLTWLWGIGNKTYITLLILIVALIPKFGLVLRLLSSFYFGIKGNEWALKNKEFKSYEHFINYQKKWTIAGLILFIFSLMFLFMTFVSADRLISYLDQNNIQKQIITQEKQFINSIFNKQKNFKEKCELTSNGLASCYEKLANNSKIIRLDNTLSINDSIITMTFIGDGTCKHEKNCKIEYKRKWTQDLTFNTIWYLKIDRNGNVNIK